MKSLQVLTPHLKCIFDCPFCISKAHKHENVFYDNYTNNFELWKENLINVIKSNQDLKYVVITGTNEPMQSQECVKDIINIVRDTNKDIQIEIQTHYYRPNIIYNMLDVVAYSISDFETIEKIRPMGKIQRYVIILTDDFNNYSLDDIIKRLPKSVTQLTFKILQDSNGAIKDFDEYIATHRASENFYNRLENDINNYHGDLSIFFDKNCMDTSDRYKIYREDGKIYNDWDEV